MQHSLDEFWMAQALRLAEQGIYSTHPNPRVGSVIVANGECVGEGWHQQAGGPHAEVHALRAAGDRAKGATAYVTLEPCSHYGRTGPCASALIEAGVRRVVMAMQDPNPQVAGQGLVRLRDAGIEVRCGVLEDQARALNQGFIQRMETGRPWVRAKLGMSLDGRTAMASGESQWITGPEARRDVQRLRAQSSVIITGADTVITDNARLTVRPEELGLSGDALHWATVRQPQRVVIDSQLRVPLDAPFFKAGSAIVATAQHIPATYAEAGHTVLSLPTLSGRVDLPELLRRLAEQGANDVLIEAGPRLVGAFAAQGLIDEYWLYMAGRFLGSSAKPLLDWPIDRMADAPHLTIHEVRPVGKDWRIKARPEH